MIAALVISWLLGWLLTIAMGFSLQNKERMDILVGLFVIQQIVGWILFFVYLLI